MEQINTLEKVSEATIELHRIKDRSVTNRTASGPDQHRTMISVKRNRISVGVIFFMHGLCFASWASRIPSIQLQLNLSSSQVGGLLFVLPAGFFLSLPVAGWLVSRAGSRKVVILAGVLYSLALSCIGWSDTIAVLTLCLFSFGFFGNLLNISINTQAVGVEALSRKPLMSTFHGMWSVAGFAGAAFGTAMIGLGITPMVHFFAITILFLIVAGFCASSLLPNDRGTDEKRPLFAWPDKSIISLGVIAFCSMMVEGAMFDWSGLYFLNVVQVDKELTGIGYTIFMIAMAGMRFMADGLSNRLGLKRMLQWSGLMTASGLLLAISFPQLAISLAGFFMVGLGVSAVVPLVYSEVGKSKTLSPGVALSAVSSLGFMGLLIGPPVIGFVAEATSLRFSFLTITVMALAVFVLATFFRRDRQREA
jgi:MFS family permease